MFSRLIGIAASLMLASAGLTVAHAADFKDELLKSDTIVIGTTGTAPPFTMTNASGELVGYDIDVMKKVGEALGLTPEFVQLEWAGLLPGLAGKRFDVVASGVTRTAERLASEDFRILSPYTVNGVAIVRRKGDERVSGWDAVCGMRMGAVRGAIQPKMALEELGSDCVSDVMEYPGWTEMLLDLKNKRVDFIVGDFLGPSYLTKADTEVEVVSGVIRPNSQSLAVAAGKPNLAEAIDALLTQYREDGTLDALLEKHFGTSVDWSKAPAS